MPHHAIARLRLQGERQEQQERQGEQPAHTAVEDPPGGLELFRAPSLHLCRPVVVARPPPSPQLEPGDHSVDEGGEDECNPGILRLGVHPADLEGESPQDGDQELDQPVERHAQQEQVEAEVRAEPDRGPETLPRRQALPALAELRRLAVEQPEGAQDRHVITPLGEGADRRRQRHIFPFSSTIFSTIGESGWSLGTRVLKGDRDWTRSTSLRESISQ